MTVIKKGSFKLKESQLQFAVKKKTLPLQLGNLAKDHFVRSFTQGGFTDSGIKRWKPRRKRLPKGRFSATEREAANLIKEGTLRRSVKVQKASFPKTVVGTRLPYAEIHNEGLPGKVFGKTPFVMPKRQFIGNSKLLEDNMERKILKELDKMFL